MKVHHFVNSRYLHMINSDTVKMKEVAQQAGLWDFSWFWWITALGIKIYPIMVSLVRSTENYYFNLSLRWCEAKPFKLMSETFEKVSGGNRGGGSNEYITFNCRPGENLFISYSFFVCFVFPYLSYSWFYGNRVYWEVVFSRLRWRCFTSHPGGFYTDIVYEGLMEIKDQMQVLKSNATCGQHGFILYSYILGTQRGWRVSVGLRISPLFFVSDVLQLAWLSHDVQLILGRFAAKCEAVGMKISTSKSEGGKRVEYPLWVRNKWSSLASWVRRDLQRCWTGEHESETVSLVVDLYSYPHLCPQAFDTDWQKETADTISRKKLPSEGGWTLP